MTPRPPFSRPKSFLRKCYWFIPPLLGGATFITMREWNRGDTAGSKLVLVQAERDDRTKARVSEALTTFDQEFEELLRAEDTGLATMDVAELKLRMLTLKQKMDCFGEETPWSVVEHADLNMRRTAFELGKRIQEEGLNWILENCPDFSRSAMGGIAEADPSLALALVVDSRRLNPCDTDTLMSLLQHEAELGPAALGKACAAIPWELFHAKDDPFDGGFEIPESADVTPWIESGAALALAKDGVDIPNLFFRWASDNPAEALSAWEDWPDIGENSSAFRVSAILHAGQANSEAASRITADLERMPSAVLEKLSAKLGEYKQINSIAATELLKLYPILTPTESEVAE